MSQESRGSHFKPAHPKRDVAISAVRLDLKTGICSAAYLGNGLLLTAAHCTADDEITLKTSIDETYPVEVLWRNTDFDISLIQAARIKNTRSSPLDCRTPPIGEAVEIVGTPQGMDQIHTRGLIAGTPRRIPGMWRVAVPVDASIIHGQSGGPVYDKFQHIVGIATGTLDGFFGFMVPGSAICPLLARE